MARARNYCFTINNYTSEDLNYLREIECKYIVVGHEVGELGTPHMQGFIALNSAKTFPAMIKYMPERAHIERCNGTPAQNITYCKKDGNIIIEKGQAPAQGTRSDLDNVRDVIKNTSKMREVVEVATSYQSVRMAEVYLSYHEKKRNWKPIVKWYYGETGSGKTKTAYEELGEDVYTASESNKWWQGYDGHENVIIDDFRKDFIKFHELLKLIDRYPYRIEYKGGSRQFLARNIIITCPFRPEEIYDTREDIEQLLRRIDEIKIFRNI